MKRKGLVLMCRQEFLVFSTTPACRRAGLRFAPPLLIKEGTEEVCFSGVTLSAVMFTRQAFLTTVCLAVWRGWVDDVGIFLHVSLIKKPRITSEAFCLFNNI
jgi:hypothetical protein